MAMTAEGMPQWIVPNKMNGQRLRIAVDTKNFSLYSGGIAAFFGPLLRAWIILRPQYDFVLVGPPFQVPKIDAGAHWQQRLINWPVNLPRPLRHPYYDNVLFPSAIRSIKPDLIFTPYHDVRLPRNVPSVMMVHDTCLHDLPDIYPFRIRGYYLHMLKHNLKVVDQVLTVSQTSKRDLQDRYNITGERSGVVPNAMDPQMTDTKSARDIATHLRAGRDDGLHVFYAGGSDHRKNIKNLVNAVLQLATEGLRPTLWITGNPDAAWTKCFKGLPEVTSSCFKFLGRLDLESLAAQYLACDVVVYPTLCEGFGRVALEAMEFGVPLACSDIEVLREVAGDYPVYFDPSSSLAIASAISMARLQKKSPLHHAEFQPAAVIEKFLLQMDAFVGRWNHC